MTTFAQTLAAITGDPVVTEAGEDTDLVLELRKGRASTWAPAPGGGSQTLDEVLAEGNDAAGLQIKNLEEGTDPADAATVSQLAGGGVANPLTEDLLTGGHVIKAADTGGGDVLGPQLDFAGEQASLLGARGFGAGEDGQLASVTGGYGDAGATNGAAVAAEGGSGDGVSHGRIYLQTDGRTALDGGAIVPDGNNRAVWGGVNRDAGPPSGSPSGFLPLYVDSDDGNALYVFVDPTWYGPYSIA